MSTATNGFTNLNSEGSRIDCILFEGRNERLIIRDLLISFAEWIRTNHPDNYRVTDHRMQCSSKITCSVQLYLPVSDCPAQCYLLEEHFKRPMISTSSSADSSINWAGVLPSISAACGFAPLESKSLAITLLPVIRL